MTRCACWTGCSPSRAAWTAPATTELITALRPRVFLLHNVHASGGAQTFQTRWCLNYLAGPLTRAQLGGLKPLGSGLEAPPPSVDPLPPVPSPLVQEPVVPQPVKRASATVASVSSEFGTRTPPASPSGVSALFLSPQLGLSQALARTGASFAGPARPEGVLYRPALLYQAEVGYHNRRYNLDASRRLSAMLVNPESARPDWEACAREPLDPSRLDAQPLPDARFASLPEWLSSARNLAAVQKDFIDWVFRTASLRLFANETLKLYSSPDDSAGRLPPAL